MTAPPTIDMDPFEMIRSEGAAEVRDVRIRLRRRGLIVSIVLAIGLVVMFGLSMVVGDFPLSLGDVLQSLVGQGSKATDFIVFELRLPRTLSGMLVGFCFGLSGAIFQSMIRNPLASPDIIGITSGASASAVVAILIFGLSGMVVSLFSLVGAAVTALAIYLLAWKQGVSGYRLVLIGIGISAMLASVIDYLMTRADIFDAQTALLWLTGSLNAISTDKMIPLLILMAVVVPITLWASRALSGLQLGDDTAKSVGIRVEQSRLMLILFGVALAAIATAAAGPIGFVAFVSGPIARRLTRGTGIALIPAGLVGAMVVTCADFAGQHLRETVTIATSVVSPGLGFLLDFADQPLLDVSLPVGVLTAAVGAPYLLYLLVVSNRVGSGG